MISMSKKTIIKNFSYLSFIQLVTLLLPFIYYPFLIREYGSENYGLIIYIQSIIILLSVFIDFGFNLYGPKLISENRSDINDLSKIYSTIIYVKLSLTFILFFIYILIVSLGSITSDHLSLSLLLFLVVCNDVFFSQWFFQGVEEIRFAAIINLITRIIMITIIFVGIKFDFGLLSFPIALVTSAMMNGFLSCYIINKRFKINFVKVDFVQMVDMVKEAYYFFMSRIVNMIILKVNSILIGNIFGVSYVAYYDLAEKLVNILQMPLNILNQVVYPRVSISKDYQLVIKIIKYAVLFSIVLYVVSYFYGYYFIIMFAGKEMINAYSIFVVLLIMLPINAINFFLGNCILIVSNHLKEFNKSILYSSIIYFIILGGYYVFSKLTIQILVNLIVFHCFIVCAYRIYYTFKSRKEIFVKDN